MKVSTSSPSRVSRDCEGFTWTWVPDTDTAESMPRRQERKGAEVERWDKVGGRGGAYLEGEGWRKGIYLHAFAQALEIPIVQPLPTCIEALDDLAALQAA